MSVEIQDEAIGNVAGKLTFWTVDGPMTGDGTTYFCNAAQVAVPPGADHFVVKLVGGFVDLVDPKVIPGDCGTTLHNYATRGEVVATFA